MWICILLALATLAPYAQVYRHDFIEYDDVSYVAENWQVTNGLSARSLAWAFTSGHAANWHPLTWISHMVDCEVFGLHAGAHHVVSLFLHIVNTILLFLVLFKLTGARWRSAFVAAFFALHPLHVQSVAWIAERKDVLSTLFWLLTVWAYARYVQKPGLPRYLFALSAFLLGLMSKPMLVSLPLVLLLLDFWPLSRFSELLPARKGDAGKAPASFTRRFLVPALPLIREKVPFFILAAASAILTYAVQQSGGAVRLAAAIPFGTRVANATNSYLMYLVKAAWPASLSIFYGYPLAGLPAWQVGAAALFLLCVTFLAVRYAGRFPYLATGWFWYVGTLVPVIGLVQVGWQAMADRYTYIPLIGIFIIVTWGAADLATGRPQAKRSLVWAGTILLAASSVATWFQVRWWRDSMSLFSHALEMDPENYLAHQVLGTVLAKRSQYGEAVSHYAEALRLRPNDPDVMSNLGLALYRLGKTREAIDQYSKALAISPEHAVALKNMGMALYDQGRDEEALAYYMKARLRAPENLALGYSLGSVLARLGRHQEALEAYNWVLRRQPDSADAMIGIGTVLSRQGKWQDAVRAFESALQIKPDSAEVQNSLGIAYSRQNLTDKALFHYRNALRLKPDCAEAHYNLAVALYGQGNRMEAINHYRDAIRLRPDYAEAHYNLGVSLEGQGDPQGAVVSYLAAIRLKPDFVAAYNNLGVVLFNQGQVQKALEALTAALQIKPDDAEARRNRDLILAAVGRSKRNP